MAGHSKWKQIKHKKEAADQKRSLLFSKLAKEISVAASEEPNPEFNPKLRTAIEKAKAANMPNENIRRAIERAKDNKGLEKLTLEAYGPGGVALIVEAISDNKNRTISEVKHILSENGARWAKAGSVLWAFHKKEEGWEAKFPQGLKQEEKEKLSELVKKLKDHPDINEVYTNAK